MTTSRKERRRLIHEQHKFVNAFPNKLTLLKPEELPTGERAPFACWRSNKYLVQLFKEDSQQFPGAVRLSICRTKLNPGLGWIDGITWEELQAIKSEIGHGDDYAVEIYPPDKDVVNVANMRHLWLIPGGLDLGWRK